VRTFIAIELDAAIRAKLTAAQDRLRQCGCRVKWTKPEQMHLTLKFLGEIEPEQVDAVKRALAMACAAAEPFEMALGGLGAFPPRGAPRVLWAGVSERAGALVALQERLEDELASLGFGRERRGFQAHVTVGRVKDHQTRGLRQAVEKGAQARFGSQEVSDVALLQSTVTPKGPIYAELFRCTLTRHEAHV